VNNHQKAMVISGEFKCELERELEHLRNDVRPQIAERLSSAREGGDLTDNTAFEQAKEDLARLMGRVSQIEQTLREATILTNGHRPQIELGSVVTITRDDGKVSQYTVVSSLEASPSAGKISDESPIGRALWGRKRGETVSVQAPGRTVSYTITEIG
jgi:transcription elongation factor GreA